MEVGTTDPTAILRQESNPSQSEIDAQRFGDDFDTFLQILTTQLQNQDPTDPLDTNEFTAQLVAFSEVEQAIAQNANLEKLIEASQDSRVNNVLNVIGKSVEVKGDKGILEGGVAEFTYELPEKADTVQVTILDEGGRAVFSGQGTGKAGRNVVFWDGVNNLNNQNMPDGTYQIVVKAQDADATELDVVTYTSGRVSAVELNEEGDPILSVGTLKVPFSEVISVREAPRAVVPTEEPPANDSAQEENTTDEPDETA